MCKDKMYDLKEEMKKSFWSTENSSPLLQKSVSGTARAVKALLIFYTINTIVIVIGFNMGSIGVYWSFVDYSSHLQVGLLQAWTTTYTIGVYTFVYVHSFMPLYHCLHINMQMRLLSDYIKQFERHTEQKEYDKLLKQVLSLVIKQHIRLVK